MSGIALTTSITATAENNAGNSNNSVYTEKKVIEKPAQLAEPTTPHGRNFAQYVTDASTTAAIKTELLASKNVKGLATDVDTLNNQVTLSEEVDAAKEKVLAQAIAAKHDDEEDVINNLQVKS